MGGWMEALAPLTKYKNEESTSHNIATFHTTLLHFTQPSLHK